MVLGGSKAVRAARLAYLALVLYQMVMAIWAVVGSKLLRGNEAGVPLAAFLAGRHFVASSALGTIAVVQHGRAALMPQRSDLFRVGVAGMLAQYGSPMFYLFGLQYLPPTIGSIFDGPLIPLLVFVMAVSIGVERLPGKVSQRIAVALALCLSSGGAVLLILASAGAEGVPSDEAEAEMLLIADAAEPQAMPSADAGTPVQAGASTGIFFIALISLFLEAACLSASFIIQKPLATKYKLFPFAFWMSFSGLCCVVFHLALYEEGGLFFNIFRLYSACIDSPSFLLAMLYNALAISVINTLCIAFANATLPSSVVALGACVQPGFTLLLDVYLYGADFTPVHVLALCIVGLGIKLFTDNNSVAAVSLQKASTLPS